MQKLKIHGIYKHFKGGYFLVEDIAIDSETQEKMVIYRHLYGDYSLWVRPLKMFVEKLDKNKYPNASQEYRFQLQDMDKIGR